MRRNLNRYPKEQSLLYRLGNKSKLCKLLQISQKDIKKLIGNDFFKVFKNKKEREIQEPIGIRKKTHEKLFKLLRKIETPKYLISKRGFSYIDNAKLHTSSHYFLCADIKQFYASSKKEYVFRFFCHEMKMAEDIAWIITDIICYNDKIPTGSSISQLIAYFSYSNIFDSFQKFSEINNFKFSLYVDDMTFSSNAPIDRTLHLKVQSFLKRVGLDLKKEKTKYFPKNKYKKITGVVISPDNKLLIPNKLMKKIVDILKQEGPVEKMSEKARKSLFGFITSARQINPKFHSGIFKKLKGVKRTESQEKQTIA